MAAPFKKGQRVIVTGGDSAGKRGTVSGVRYEVVSGVREYWGVKLAYDAPALDDAPIVPPVWVQDEAAYDAAQAEAVATAEAPQAEAPKCVCGSVGTSYTTAYGYLCQTCWAESFHGPEAFARYRAANLPVADEAPLFVGGDWADLPPANDFELRVEADQARYADYMLPFRLTADEAGYDFATERV